MYDATNSILKAHTLVISGTTIDKACKKAGIAHSTYYRWKAKQPRGLDGKVEPEQAEIVKTPKAKTTTNKKTTKAKIIRPPLLKTAKGEIPSPLLDKIKTLKANGRTYQQIAQKTQISMAEVFKQITGKNIVEEVDRIALEKNISKEKACSSLKMPISAYTTQRYKEKKKIYNDKYTAKKRRAKRKLKSFDLAVPSVEQVEREIKESREHSREHKENKKNDNDKVIIMVCSADKVSSLLKGIQ